MYYIVDSSFTVNCAELLMKNVNYNNFFHEYVCNWGASCRSCRIKTLISASAQTSDFFLSQWMPLLEDRNTSGD